MLWTIPAKSFGFLWARLVIIDYSCTIRIAAMLWFPTRLQPSCKAFEKRLLLQMGPANWLRWYRLWVDIWNIFQHHERRCNIEIWTLHEIPDQNPSRSHDWWLIKVLLRHLRPQHGFSQRLKMLHLTSSGSWTSMRMGQDAQVTSWEAVKTHQNIKVC